MNIAGARVLAKLIHKSQMYGSLSYYEGHLLPVATLVSQVTANKDAHIAAILHDSLEDSGLVLEDLINLGISMEAAYAIDALTRKPNEKYFDYIRKLKKNKLAVIIKKIDLSYNIRNQPNPSLNARYQKALEILNT